MKVSQIIWVVIFATGLAIRSIAQNKIGIGVGTDISSSAQRKESAEKIANYLANKLGKTVEIIVTDKNTELVQLFQENKIQLAFFNTFGYILAANEVEIEPLVVIADEAKQPVSYSSCIITYPNSAVKTLKELKELKGKIDFLFVNPTSTSGHLVPRLLFNSIGMDYSETHFNKIEFAGNHLNTIIAIKEKKFEAGACSFDDLQKAIKNGILKENEIHILWKSEPIVNGPVAVAKNLDKIQKEQISKAFLTMSQEKPELLADIQKLWHISQEAKSYDFTPAFEKFYDSVKSMANSMEELILIINYYID
ncbi:MAG: phosphate/phosphite/phosphonate ABC transporter substrate-binding protein [Microscillaceae bacterium]|nr:phosphate/phosphite/phosphonate ABC transporter substrate-binding protein [Microscillaceae bacterium]MDW8460797.1 phosphate/phosphite/phosphonate ABC transporter substrate-binding protein [Cytophagales bacterium]